MFTLNLVLLSQRLRPGCQATSPRQSGSPASASEHRTVSDESKGQDHHVEESEHQVFRLPFGRPRRPPVARRTITHPPIWMSTDLRDGNQALFEPMNPARKLQMFRKLVAIGFKEIEVAFPSASQTDFDFVRKLIEENEVPDDVTIEVLSQAREHLIRRTMESLKGARRAIVHIYNATSPVFRETVFGMSKDEVKALAVDSVTLVKQLAAEQPETEFILEYSPETFTATELAFAKEVCDAVVAAWDPQPGEKVIINLPSTVEVAGPQCVRRPDRVDEPQSCPARADRPQPSPPQ
jgi:2-isopropylmalate synthase